ncbi:uncharacterized protein G2W53_018384 [Senna tora]|uniref:Uncharacterized protein n=1 Tax=Senna tora TaxID=362788 RepID=A0A834TRP3_9FABA|nr:uncharacterized protein G2W53_018384 [Senna tora]
MGDERKMVARERLRGDVHLLRTRAASYRGSSSIIPQLGLLE